MLRIFYLSIFYISITARKKRKKISFSFATLVEYNLICEQFEKIENFPELQNYFRLREVCKKSRIFQNF